MKLKKRQYDYCLIFLIALEIRIVSFIINGKLHLMPDEMGFLIPAAKLAGRDWSDIIPLCSYYGFGYSTLFTPLFWITDNLYIIFWTIMCVGAVCISASAVITYHLLTKHFDVDNRFLAGLIAIICSILSFSEMKVINNEPIIVLVCWTCCWLFIMVLKEDEKKQRYCNMLIIVMTYALTIHNRLIVLWVALALFVFIYYIFYRKWIFKRKDIILAAISFFAMQIVVSFAAKYFWLSESNSALYNSVDETSGIIIANLVKNFTSWSFWKAAIDILNGNIYTVLFFSCGMFAFAVIMVVFLLRSHCKKGTELLGSEEKRDGADKNIEAISLWFLLIFLITLAGLILIWSPNVMSGREKGYSSASAYKIFSYLRYYQCYISIFMMAFFAYAYRHLDEIRKYILGAGVICLLEFIYWYAFIVPDIKTSSDFVTVFGAYGLYSSANETTQYELYLLCGTIQILLFVGICLCFGRRKLLCPAWCMAILLLFRLEYNSSVLNFSNEFKAKAGYEAIRMCEEICELPEEIYCNLPKTYAIAWQLLLNDYKMTRITDFPTESDAIVATNVISQAEKHYSEGYQCLKLDEQVFLWIKGEYLQNSFSQTGFDFLRLDEINEKYR